jgi:hypothetical protein
MVFPEEAWPTMAKLRISAGGWFFIKLILAWLILTGWLMAESHFKPKHRRLARPNLTFPHRIFRATHLQAGGEIVFCLNRRFNGKRSAQNFID